MSRRRCGGKLFHMCGPASDSVKRSKFNKVKQSKETLTEH